MRRLKLSNLNTFVTALFFAAVLILFSCGAYADSVPSASGCIDSWNGAILRQSSSTDSEALCVLADNSEVTIHKEVFKSRTSTARINKWYYVTAGGRRGYVRSDLVDNIKYHEVSGRTTSSVNYRKGAGTGMEKAGSFSKGAAISIVLKAMPAVSPGSTGRIWYKIKKGSYYYYVSSSGAELTDKAEEPAQASDGSSEAASESVSTKVPDPAMTDKEFDQYLKDEGFPESYRKKLRVLHKAHPDWVFVGYKTNISWDTALSKQTRKGTSLVSASCPKSYRDGTKQYEKGWYKANRRVVAYYMDPRNFLNSERIYMFEDLSYRPKYQTKSVVSSILSPSKLPRYGFTADMFVKAGKASKISPVFLAARARQETGGGSDAINGSKILGKKVYNPFNIGAFGGKNPLRNGLLYAYKKGWTTRTKSVKGGARELAKNYISKGQNTIYYQRFNVRNGRRKAGTHQYMTNIMAPYSEAGSTKTSYSRYGMLKKPLVFEIPIYKNMPASTRLP